MRRGKVRALTPKVNCPGKKIQSPLDKSRMVTRSAPEAGGTLAMEGQLQKAAG
jgi:hypothetical protein